MTFGFISHSCYNFVMLSNGYTQYIELLSYSIRVLAHKATPIGGKTRVRLAILIKKRGV